MSESQMQPPTQPMPAASPDDRVEPCRECGAPLAADQRYCLNCGRRRGEPRLDFRRYGSRPAATANGERSVNGNASPAAGAAPVPASAAPAEGKPQRDYTPLAAVGGIAVLGLMLLVGVLIGRGDGNQATAPPQVVRVEGGDETAANEDEGTLGGAGASAKRANKGKSSGKGGAVTAGGKAPPPEITASDSELEALQGKSPQEYSEASAKLPDEIATPGEAPPVDGKAPGGGSGATAIE